jgi:hypothetical protein
MLAKERQSYRGVPPSLIEMAFFSATGRNGAYLQTPMGLFLKS